MVEHPITTFPRLSVLLGGRPLQGAETLASVTIVQQLSRPALCELRYRDPVDELAAGDLVQAGDELKVTLEESGTVLFRGDVTALDYLYEPARGRELRIRAGDPLHRLRRRQPVRAHVEITLEDLARDLLAADGITVRASAHGCLRKKLMQFRQTDFDLLAEVAAAEGLHFVIRGETLHICTLEGLPGSTTLLTLGRELLEARVALDGADACVGVAASGWDPWTSALLRGQAGRPRVGLETRTRVDPERLGSTGEWHLCDELAQIESQAQAMAQAERDDRAARVVILDGVADGDVVRLSPGQRLELAGVAPALCGRYVATRVTHRIDHEHGYVIEFSTRPPEPRHRPWSPILTFGVVTNVADPDGAGRVKVAYPTYANLESDWLQVVIPGAGKDKGLAALPDLEDRVLVAFLRQDAAQAVVLGGLWGAAPPPDEVVKGGAVQRFSFRTKGGQLVRLDDETGSLRLESSDGSFFEMTPEKLHIHSRVALDIEAPGQKVTIRGGAIDFGRA